MTPPTLTSAVDAARFRLRFDVLDSSVSPAVFFADKGNPPLDNPVIVNKVLEANIGLEHFWQFTSQPVGAGITQMTNVANGNSVLSLTPLTEAGRGLSTAMDLTYNSLEEHSDSPMGNNWSLSLSGLTRFGDDTVRIGVAGVRLKSRHAASSLWCPARLPTSSAARSTAGDGAQGFAAE